MKAIVQKSKIELYDESRTVYEVTEEAMNSGGKVFFVTKPGNLICNITGSTRLKKPGPISFKTQI
jgi:hypothetical protein